MWSAAQNSQYRGWGGADTRNANFWSRPSICISASETQQCQPKLSGQLSCTLKSNYHCTVSNLKGETKVEKAYMTCPKVTQLFCGKQDTWIHVFLTLKPMLWANTISKQYNQYNFLPFSAAVFLFLFFFHIFGFHGDFAHRHIRSIFRMGTEFSQGGEQGKEGNKAFLRRRRETQLQKLFSSV